LSASILSADLRVRRGGFELAARFELSMAGITVVFGPSGAGKSMLLSAIAGLARLEQGRIATGEVVLEDVAQKVRVPTSQRGIGVVFQDARLFPHLSVRGNLEYAAKRAPGPHTGIEQTAADFDLADKLDRPIQNLSGGERARVALARAMLSRSRLLLLDEPFASLDGVRRRAYLKLIMDVSAQRALPMVVVTHQIEDAAELADNVLALREGRLVASGAADTVMASPELRRLLDARDVGARLPTGMLSAATPAAGRARGVWVRADNVLLAAEEPRGLSARNVWPGQVAAMETEPDGSILVTLGVGQGYILSRITRDAAEQLKFGVGGRAWAVVKAHAS
jgi:molybdate transport system ATP-binding protein